MGYEPSSKPEHKVKIGPIKSIPVRADRPRWGLSNDQKAGLCHFDLTENEVRDYFLRVKIVSQYSFRSFPISDCFVEGEIVFADGRRGTWMIERGRRGVLEITGGGKAYLYNKDAQANAFEKP